jgi:hypothetical protein
MIVLLDAGDYAVHVLVEDDGSYCCCRRRGKSVDFRQTSVDV